MFRPADRTARSALRPAPPPCGVRGITPVYGGKGTRMAASVNRESNWAVTYAPPDAAASPPLPFEPAAPAPSSIPGAPSPVSREVWA